MSTEANVPLPTSELVARLIMAERDCIAAWLRAMEREPGNPFGIAMREWGGATALVCGRVPAQVFNRVFGMAPENREHIPAMLQFYRDHGAAPVFDLNPYAIPPFWVTPNITDALARSGLYQAAFHQILYGVPTPDVPEPPAHLQIKQVGPEAAAEFGRVYEQVWGSGSQITVLLGHPEFRCYLAYVEGKAAALSVLHIANGVASLANGLTDPRFRDRGCHTALLLRRIHDAAAAGCDLLVSQCTPGTISQRNQLRAGLHIAGTKAWWVPLPAEA